MKATVEKTYTLILSEAEAKWLKELMKTLFDADETMSIGDCDMRDRFYYTLDGAQRGEE